MPELLAEISRPHEYEQTGAVVGLVQRPDGGPDYNRFTPSVTRTWASLRASGRLEHTLNRCFTAVDDVKKARRRDKFV